MDRPPPGPLYATIVVLGVSNVVSNRVLPRRWYIPWNVAVTSGVLGIAILWDDRSPSDLGLSEWRRGLRWGSALAAGVLAVDAAALVVPATRELFDDERASREPRRLMFDALVAVPLGTVLLEEVAFRGALPAVVERRSSPRTGVATAAAAFGLWHILPSWSLADANAGLSGAVTHRGGRLVTVVGSVVATSAVGIGFSWLRRRSGSILAPIIVHTATNSLGYLFAWALRRRRG